MQLLRVLSYEGLKKEVTKQAPHQACGCVCVHVWEYVQLFPVQANNWGQHGHIAGQGSLLEYHLLNEYDKYLCHYYYSCYYFTSNAMLCVITCESVDFCLPWPHSHSHRLIACPASPPRRSSSASEWAHWRFHSCRKEARRSQVLNPLVSISEPSKTLIWAGFTSTCTDCLSPNYGLSLDQQVALAPFEGNASTSATGKKKWKKASERNWGVKYSHIHDDDHVLWRWCTLNIPAKRQKKSALICSQYSLHEGSHDGWNCDNVERPRLRRPDLQNTKKALCDQKSSWVISYPAVLATATAA